MSTYYNQTVASCYFNTKLQSGSSSEGSTAASETFIIYFQMNWPWGYFMFLPQFVVIRLVAFSFLSLTYLQLSTIELLYFIWLVN